MSKERRKKQTEERFPAECKVVGCDSRISTEQATQNDGFCRACHDEIDALITDSTCCTTTTDELGVINDE